MGGTDGALSFSAIHATPPRFLTIADTARLACLFARGFASRILHSERTSSVWFLVMQRTHSHYTVCEDFASLRNIGALVETTLGERRLRKLEGFLLRAVVTASYGGAWLIEALMRCARRAFTVRANQGRSL